MALPTEQKNALLMASLQDILQTVENLRNTNFDYAYTSMDIWPDGTAEVYSSHSRYIDVDVDMQRSQGIETPLVCSLDKAEQEMTAIVMRANEFDGHGVYTTDVEVKKAMYSYTEDCPTGNMNLMHALDTESHIVQNFIAPCDFNLTNPKGEVMVKANKGDWIATAKLSDSDWGLALSGVIDSFSIDATGNTQEITENV